MTYWLETEWASEEYQKIKYQNFELLSNALHTPPINLLDIGCGLAWESRLINKKYDTTLWLLDGDSSTNDNKPVGSKDINYHTTADSFLFYHSLALLDNKFKEFGLTNYKLMDTNNIQIPDTIKFDIIVSWLSCGFHYPVSTYKDLIQKHSTEQTRIFVDIRTALKTGEPIIEDGVEIIKIISRRRKVINAEIKFL